MSTFKSHGDQTIGCVLVASISSTQNGHKLSARSREYQTKIVLFDAAETWLCFSGFKSTSVNKGLKQSQNTLFSRRHNEGLHN